MLFAQFADGPSRRSSTPSPPLTGLALWLKGDVGVTQSGGLVSAWADQSGNGNNATAAGAARPAYNASSINGVPGLTFDGASTIMQSTTNVVPSGTARSVILVAKCLGNTVPVYSPNFAGCPFSFRLAAPGFNCILGVGGTGFVFSDGSIAPTIAGDAGNADAPTEYEWFSDAVNISFNLDAAPQTLSGSTALHSDTGTSGYMVGARSGSIQLFSGDICEILAYDHVLSGADLTVVRTYLESKYGIALGAP